MLIRPTASMIVDQQVVSPSFLDQILYHGAFLDQILYHGALISNSRSLDHSQKQSTRPWQMEQLKQPGYNLC
jgi:hypothetical protein